MHISKKIKVYGTVIIALLVVAVMLRVMLPSGNTKPPPNAPGYYTGPMRGKGNPNFAATEDGKSVDLPPLKEAPVEKAPAASGSKSASSPPSKDAP